MKLKYWLKDKLYEVPSYMQHGQYAQDNFNCIDESDAINKGYARIRIEDGIFYCDFNKDAFNNKLGLIHFINSCLPCDVNKICLNIIKEIEDYKEFEPFDKSGISLFINSSRRNNMKIQSDLAAFDRAIAKKYNGTEPNGAGQYYLDWKYNLADEKDYIEQLADENDLSVEFQSDEGYFEVFSSRKPIKSSFVINYYDEAGYVENNFIDANAKGLVSSPVGAMTFDTMEDAQSWIDTQAADNLFDPEYCEIQPVDDEIESACHGKSKKAKKPVKSGRFIKSGAGAGYDVTIEGLELDVNNFKVLERDEESIHVQVPVKPCVVDKWAAADYYNGVSSDGIEIDYTPVMEYGNDDKKVDGGSVNITIDIWENDDYSTDESIRDTLPSTIDFTASYGWGWVHSNLPEDGMHFDYESIKEPDIGAYGEMHIDEIDLKCPNICENINWFFAHDHELEEIFFGDDEDNE